MTKSERVPILGIFSPKTILMFRVGLKKIRVGRPTGTTHTFHFSLIVKSVREHYIFLMIVAICAKEKK